MMELKPELVTARCQVAEGRERLGRQIETIAALSASGEETRCAEERLAGLTLALEADCKRLERLYDDLCRRQQPSRAWTGHIAGRGGAAEICQTGGSSGSAQ
jgi:hypothetical protein